jgi:hypothetical protein
MFISTLAIARIEPEVPVLPSVLAHCQRQDRYNRYRFPENA